MDFLFQSLSLISLGLACFLMARLLGPMSMVDTILFYFLASSGSLALIGNILSCFGVLSQPKWWLTATASLSLFLLLAAVRYAKPGRFPTSSAQARSTAVTALSTETGPLSRSSLRALWIEARGSHKIWVTAPLLTLILVGLVNFVLIVLTVPHATDSMLYHLPRMAYYLQHGSMEYFHANYWAHVGHPTNSAVMFLYVYLLTGRNESLIQLVQFVAYWVAICAVYGISRKAHVDRPLSLCSAAFFGLLIACVMESTTVQNDMLVAAYVAVAVFYLLAFKERREKKSLALFSASVALALGVKATTIIALPSLSLVVIYSLLAGRAQHPEINARDIARSFAALCLFLCLSLGLFTLPSGYWQNLRNFGHILGPPAVPGHLLTDFGSEQWRIQGTKNLLRYGMDFVSLDGMPAVGPVVHLQRMIRWAPLEAIRGLGIDLDSGIHHKYPYDRHPSAHEEVSYWGVLGFALIWPMAVALCLGVVRSPPGRVLAIGAILFVVCQSFAFDYSPWHGRFFITAAAFATPALACSLAAVSSLTFKRYVTVVALLGCVSALGAVLFRHDAWLFSFRYKDKSYTSIFSLDRIAQMTRSDKELYAALKKFDDITPKNAVVCVCVPDLSFEYPLFGEKLTRTIIPGNFLSREPVSPPQAAEFLLFSTACQPPRDRDIFLGLNWYLRDLRPTAPN